MQIERSALLSNASEPTGAARSDDRQIRLWRHPFDSATGTITLGVLLTVVLVLALRLLGG